MQDAEAGLTLREIRRQPDTWREALAAMASAAPAFSGLLARSDFFLFTGCGSSYYLAIAAARFFQETTGRSARAVPASELILSRETYLPAGACTALVGFSRSGETTETVTALRRRCRRCPDSWPLNWSGNCSSASGWGGTLRSVASSI